MWAFFRNYVLRRGFLLGEAGLTVSALNAYYTFVKLAKLRELARRAAPRARRAREGAARGHRRAAGAAGQNQVLLDGARAWRARGARGRRGLPRAAARSRRARAPPASTSRAVAFGGDLVRRARPARCARLARALPARRGPAPRPARGRRRRCWPRPRAARAGRHAAASTSACAGPLSRWKYRALPARDRGEPGRRRRARRRTACPRRACALVYEGVPDRPPAAGRARRAAPRWACPRTRPWSATWPRSPTTRTTRRCWRRRRWSSRACPDARFVIVGDGELRGRARARRPRRSASQGRVVFAGFRTDLDRLLPAFDVFCLSSHMEGLGTSLLDAMCFGAAGGGHRGGRHPGGGGGRRDRPRGAPRRRRPRWPTRSRTCWPDRAPPRRDGRGRARALPRALHRATAWSRRRSPCTRRSREGARHPEPARRPGRRRAPAHALERQPALARRRGASVTTARGDARALRGGGGGGGRATSCSPWAATAPPTRWPGACSARAPRSGSCPWAPATASRARWASPCGRTARWPRWRTRCAARMDVGMVNGRPFLNVAGAGFDAAGRRGLPRARPRAAGAAASSPTCGSACCARGLPRGAVDARRRRGRRSRGGRCVIAFVNGRQYGGGAIAGAGGAARRRPARHRGHRGRAALRDRLERAPGCSSGGIEQFRRYRHLPAKTARALPRPAPFPHHRDGEPEEGATRAGGHGAAAGARDPGAAGDGGRPARARSVPRTR